MDSLNYKDSGVDIEEGYKAIDLIKKHINKTKIKGVLGDIGSFGGMFELPTNFKEPVLVSGTDGVGTKLQIAFKTNVHNTIGIDCVAMCVNDIACQGAKPLFFLDYIGTGKLYPDKIESIVEGVSAGCVDSGCALIGGETAEMPGFYQDGEYDIAGFCVGIAEKSKLINGSRVKNTDVIIGLASSGLHSNGYSLVRKLFFEINKCNINDKFDELENTLGEELLKPTKIYVKAILKTLEKYPVNGIAHITGGGFIENIPRAYGSNLQAKIKLEKYTIPPIFKLIQRLGNISDEIMYNTFNMGIGLIMIVDKEISSEVVLLLNSLGEKAYEIGYIKEREDGEGVICLE